MILKTSHIRKLFNERKVQINDDAINVIGDMVERDIRKMVARCVEGNVPRLTSVLIYIALGNMFHHKEE